MISRFIKNPRLNTKVPYSPVRLMFNKKRDGIALLPMVAEMCIRDRVFTDIKESYDEESEDALHFSVNGIDYYPSVQAAERVPESGVGKHITGTHFAVVGAVIHDLPLSVYLIETAWKKHGTV